MKEKLIYNKICNYCHNEFGAYRRTTMYCSHKCNQRAYKQNKKEKTFQKVNTDDLTKTVSIKTNLLLEEIANSVKAIQIQFHLINKPYLTLKETSELLNISKASIYRLTKKGILPTYDIGLDKQFIKRTDIDNLFQKQKSI